MNQKTDLPNSAYEFPKQEIILPERAKNCEKRYRICLVQ